MVKDPVCGKRINRGRAHAVVEYQHVAYFLCCPLCQAQFESAPQVYAKPGLGKKTKESHRLAYRR